MDQAIRPGSIRMMGTCLRLTGSYVEIPAWYRRWSASATKLHAIDPTGAWVRRARQSLDYAFGVASDA